MEERKKSYSPPHYKPEMALSNYSIPLKGTGHFNVPSKMVVERGQERYGPC
jgi:hypothetical protein